MQILRVKLTNIKWPKKHRYILDTLPVEDEIVFDGRELGRIPITDLIDEYLDDVYLLRPEKYEFEIC